MGAQNLDFGRFEARLRPNVTGPPVAIRFQTFEG
jgi:hypothetical protein